MGTFVLVHGARAGAHGFRHVRRRPQAAGDEAFAPSLTGVGELTEIAKVAGDSVELASFDPFFTFFQGGVAAFDGARRVGAVGVSGLAGSDDDALARRAIAATGLGDGSG